MQEVFLANTEKEGEIWASLKSVSFATDFNWNWNSISFCLEEVRELGLSPSYMCKGGRAQRKHLFPSLLPASPQNGKKSCILWNFCVKLLKMCLSPRCTPLSLQHTVLAGCYHSFPSHITSAMALLCNGYVYLVLGSIVQNTWVVLHVLVCELGTA